MNSEKLKQVVDAVLYEGYILYPYRASSKKNRRERFTFGRVYPKGYSDAQRGAEPWQSQTECLVRVTGEQAELSVSARFLQPMWREVGCLSGAEFEVVPEILIGDKLYQTWQEATERDISVRLGNLDGRRVRKVSVPFSFAASRNYELLPHEPGVAECGLVRRHEAVEGILEVGAVPGAAGVYKITTRVMNGTAIADLQCEDSDAVIMRTFASTHTILGIEGGEFISLLDPPAELREWAEDCKNVGTWPVLVGDEAKGERDTMLSSPIILYDYPQIAPESVGGFFDGTEIDEILTLRVMTMTDDEKMEMRGVDEFARQLLERTETEGAESLMKMHGMMREVKNVEEFFNPTTAREKVFLGGQELKVGGRVRIQPKRRADAFDMMLAGKVGIIEAIEQDAEEQIHLALVLEDDPGRDLGMARQTGHRFFYTLEEVEPLEETTA